MIPYLLDFPDVEMCSLNLDSSTSLKVRKPSENFPHWKLKQDFCVSQNVIRKSQHASHQQIQVF